MVKTKLLKQVDKYYKGVEKEIIIKYLTSPYVGKKIKFPIRFRRNAKKQ